MDMGNKDNKRSLEDFQVVAKTRREMMSSSTIGQSSGRTCSEGELEVILEIFNLQYIWDKQVET